MSETELTPAPAPAFIDELAGVRFGVITKVCPPESGGNMAAAFDIYQVVPGEGPKRPGGVMEQIAPLPLESFFVLRQEVFHVGEVLILDGSGREIPYPGRKPGKWDVECEQFADLQSALARSREVLHR